MTDQSRREFLAVSSAVVALATLGERARAEQVVERRLARVEGEAARDVAMAAVQAAREAGASYADVRVDVDASQAVSVWQHHAAGSVRYGERFVYGVRVIANGQWGFAGDIEPTVDAAARGARRAVAQATANAALRRTPVALAPAPVVADGRWATPIELDPFAVSPGEQQELLQQGVQAALRVRGIRSAGGTLAFSRTVRTFASSDGSFIVQTFWFANPSASASAAAAHDPDLVVSRSLPALSRVAGGYEVVRDARLEAGMTEAADAAVRGVQSLARAKPVDVGRYDVVLSASAMAGLITGTLGQATGWNRVSGRDASYEGTSFAAPPERALGHPIASPLVTLIGDRVLKGGLGTAAWDDEGVSTSTFPLIDQGVLVDYQTTREGAAALDWWYAERGRAARSNGCASGGGLTTPREAMPNVVMRPGRTAARVAELVADVERGILFTDELSGGMDDTLHTGAWWAPLAYVIRHGKVAEPVRDVGMQFRTQQLWMALDAVGGAASAESVGVGTATVRAVPGRFRGVAITSSGLAV